MIAPLEIKFGYPGNSFSYQGTGWSAQESDGVWMLDKESVLIIARPEEPGDYLLEVDLEPSIAYGTHDFQRLAISVNGVSISHCLLRSSSVVQCWIPWSVLGGPLKSMILLSHPDAWSPLEANAGEGDQRVLSFFVRTIKLSWLTELSWTTDHLRPEDEAKLGGIIAQQQNLDGLAMNSLLLDFESLGLNCELVS